MSDWTTTTLGSFIALQRGHDLPARDRRPGPIPVVGSGGVVGWHDTSVVRGPGIAVGRAANLGAPTLVLADFWPLNTTLYVTDFHGNDVRFTYYLLKSIDLTGFNSGSVQPMLNRNYVRNFPLVVPKPLEQQRIATALQALDDKITVNERICSTHESILRLRFAGLGVDSDPAPGHEVPVSELMELNPQTPPPTIDEAVYLEMAVVPTQSARVTGWSRRQPKSGTRFQNGDTVMARITPCLENGKVGFIDFMDEAEVGVGSTEFIVLRARPDIPTHLPYFLARSPRFQAHAVQNMSGSSGRQRVGAEALAQFVVNRPDPRSLQSFGEAARPAFAHMKALDAESSRLAELRDMLLPGLMSGVIRVREAEAIVSDAT